MTAIDNQFDDSAAVERWEKRPYPIKFMTFVEIMGLGQRRVAIHEENFVDLIDDLHQSGFTDRDMSDIEVEGVFVYPVHSDQGYLLTIPIDLWAYPVGDEMRLYDIEDLPRWDIHEDADESWGPEEAIIRF